MAFLYRRKRLFLPVVALAFCTNLFASAAETKCPMPAPNASVAFSIIEKPGTQSLRDFLKNNVVGKTALNSRCETMYHAVIRTKNDLARVQLDSLNYGPKTANQVNTPYPKLVSEIDLNFYEYALITGNKKTIKELKSRGGELSREMVAEGINALHLASTVNTKDVVEVLFGPASDINAATKDGLTALMIAAENNSKKDVVELLIRSGADINAADKDVITALMFAAKNNSKDVVELLIRSGADINAADKNGATVLMYAAGNNSKDVVELLIRSGADINAALIDGATALIFAAEMNSKDVVELLILSGADINTTNKIGLTALMVAAKFNSKDVIEFLIQGGIRKDAVDTRGSTAYTVAVQYKRSSDILSLLK